MLSVAFPFPETVKKCKSMLITINLSEIETTISSSGFFYFSLLDLARPLQKFVGVQVFQVFLEIEKKNKTS